MASFHHKGRIRAFEVLFEAEFALAAAATVLQRRQAGEPLGSGDAAFAEGLIRGVAAHRAEIDTCLQKVAPDWPLADVSAVDRTILRVALYELLFNNAAVPSAAVINEAVEIAKRYGSDASRRFVNGVLGTVSRERITHRSASTTETEETGGPV